MLSGYDSRIVAFKRIVEEAKGLCHQFNAAEHDGLIADDTTARLADPGKGDDLEHLRRLRAGLGDIAVLRSRYAAAKLRIQLHLGKGRTIKRAAVDAVREILLSAVGGEASLKTCSIGPLRPALPRRGREGWRLVTCGRDPPASEPPPQQSSGDAGACRQ